MKTLSALFLILICVNAMAQSNSIKATFAGKTEGNISKKELIEGEGLKIITADDDTSWKVESYRMSIAGKGIAYKEFDIKGNTIPHDVDSIINKMQAGVKIYIMVLRVAQHKSLRGIHPMEFVLTD